jgi:hypothetical protein
MQASRQSPQKALTYRDVDINMFRDHKFICVLHFLTTVVQLVEALRYKLIIGLIPDGVIGIFH